MSIVPKIALGALRFSLNSNLRQQVDDLRNKHPGVQITFAEMVLIYKTILEHKNCNMLIFGLGNDSPIWHALNKDGRTVFLEESLSWLEKATQNNSELEAYLIEYPTKLKNWKTLLNDSSSLQIQLPNEIQEVQWDIILVDAPSAYNDECPGRMTSIYMSSKLIKAKGDVFVHDVDRTVEQVYSKKYLLQSNCTRHWYLILMRSILAHFKLR